MERGSPDSFTRMGTLGIEEEYFVVDERGRPTSGTDALVYEHDPPAVLDGKLDHELFKFVIEAQTPLIERPGEAGKHLRSIREALVDHADRYGFQIAAAGLHPLAKWRELEHAEKPRYRAQLDRIQYPQQRNTTAGVHVHVGVDDADKAVWIANEARWHVPIVLALSANSPYWDGFDTGLQSARAKIFEALPNTGMPTYFEDYAAFDWFERRMLETGSILDRGELWFDVRPHTAHGTVEMRAPDAQADPEVVLAFVEYVHALVEALGEEYEDGTPPSRLRREVLDENKWRAIRYGHDAAFIDREAVDPGQSVEPGRSVGQGQSADPDGTIDAGAAVDAGGVVDLGEVVDRECERLGIDGIRHVYDAESGASRQRRIRAEAGVDALCESLVLQTSCGSADAD